jgi:hypothetical protein
MLRDAIPGRPSDRAMIRLLALDLDGGATADVAQLLQR